MPNLPILLLDDRSVVLMSGEEAERFLQRLITTDLDDLKEGQAHYGALLTPQGKISMDFLISRTGAGFRFDLDKGIADAFMKKMMLYRMRSKVVIEQSDEAVGVLLSSDKDEAKAPDSAFKDMRSDLLGTRLYADGAGWLADGDLAEAYLKRHIDAVVAQAGLDFQLNDSFPHDINMDYLGGLDFDKGCYVGQEVVSRMQHRGTARRRLVRVEANSPMPATGTVILADGKPIGTLGAVVGHQALAILRIDRVLAAKGAGCPIRANDLELSVIVPDYADF
ncbi:folate-binding protein [uncultured Cohaesibacter sp.]|uniref:CAF17-like 4Fe-4S cluster assembly/insertion protein YgfZ n=1 Tax=uncultured Cohaesibacter sp. TaxID=1002546 RepID=UPI00293022C3|nr:folate-binding protein [uncultured Cohaesibacter sp.]